MRILLTSAPLDWPKSERERFSPDVMQEAHPPRGTDDHAELLIVPRAARRMGAPQRIVIDRLLACAQWRGRLRTHVYRELKIRRLSAHRRHGRTPLRTATRSISFVEERNDRAPEDAQQAREQSPVRS